MNRLRSIDSFATETRENHNPRMLLAGIPKHSRIPLLAQRYCDQQPCAGPRSRLYRELAANPLHSLPHAS
jgi:hypothetical protein